MDAHDSLEEFLQQLDLTDNHQRIFKAIVERGNPTVSTLAEETGISRPHVYSSFEQLQKLGLVEVTTDRPRRAQPASPSAIFERYSDSLNQFCSAIAQESNEVVSIPESLLDPEDQLREKIRTLLRAAKKEVVFSMPLPLLDEVREPLAECVDRGVLVLLLITGTESYHRDFPLSAFKEIATVTRECIGELSLLLTVDSETSILASPARFFTDEDPLQPFQFHWADLSRYHTAFFLHNFWQMGDPLVTRPPRPLPATFTHFRQGVVELELHRPWVEDLRVTVEGHDHDASDPLRGRVVETRQRLVAPQTNIDPLDEYFNLETDTGTYTIGGADSVRFSREPV